LFNSRERQSTRARNDHLAVKSAKMNVLLILREKFGSRALKTFIDLRP